MTTDPIITALAEHQTTGVTGGIATGSTWWCTCGTHESTPGDRHHAATLGRAHVAAKIREALEASDTRTRCSATRTEAR